MRDNIREIINRTPPEYDQQELIDVVEYYINIRKGVTVTIGVNPYNPPLEFIRQMNMLSEAFDTAKNWLLENHK